MKKVHVMMSTLFAIIIFLLLPASVSANNSCLLGEPGSLLVYPLIDNINAAQSLRLPTTVSKMCGLAG